MSPFASACLVQAVLVDGGWYWLCLLHCHANNFQTFAQAQKQLNTWRDHCIGTIGTIRYNDVQCLFLTISTHGAHWMPAQRLFGLINQQKICHFLCVAQKGTLTFKPRLCIHAGSLISVERQVSMVSGENCTCENHCDILCLILWSFVILGKPLLTLCAFTSRLMTSGSGISRGLCQEVQFKVNLQKHRDVAKLVHEYAACRLIRYSLHIPCSFFPRPQSSTPRRANSNGSFRNAKVWCYPEPVRC